MRSERSDNLRGSLNGNLFKRYFGRYFGHFTIHRSGSETITFGMHECIPYESSVIFLYNVLPQKSLPSGMHKCIPYEHKPTNTNFTTR